MTNLEQLRLARGLTQETISGVVGIAVSTYSMYENGKRAVPRQIAERIAKAVGCRLEDIFLPEKFTVSKSEEHMLSEPDTGSKSEEAVCSDLYYKRLEKSLSKNFDEDNASTKPQKFVDVDSEC